MNREQETHSTPPALLGAEVSLGVIKAVYGSPGPASGITYDVWVNFDNSPMLVTGIKPSNPQYEDTMDSRGPGPGVGVVVFKRGNEIGIQIHPLLSLAACP